MNKDDDENYRHRVKKKMYYSGYITFFRLVDCKNKIQKDCRNMIMNRIRILKGVSEDSTDYCLVH